MSESETGYRTYCCRAPVESDDSESGHFPRVQCPECGERGGAYAVELERSTGGHYCPVADLPDAPTRMRVYQHLIAASLQQPTHTTNERIRSRLALPDSKEKTVSRAISDAIDAGWVERSGSGVSSGPLADIIVARWSSGGEP
jgi:hypothetical protein